MIKVRNQSTRQELKHPSGNKVKSRKYRWESKVAAGRLEVLRSTVAAFPISRQTMKKWL